MTREEHRQRHIVLHKALDELLADYMRHHPERGQYLNMPVLQLMEWSHEQAAHPTEVNDGERS